MLCICIGCLYLCLLFVFVFVFKFAFVKRVVAGFLISGTHELSSLEEQ